MAKSAVKAKSKKELKNTPFSKTVLFGFAVFFAMLGGFAVIKSFADVPGAVGDCVIQPSWGTLQLQMEQDFINDVNQDRANNGLPALQPATALTRTARYKAMNLAEYQNNAHDDPAPVARSYQDRFYACGYPTKTVGFYGENWDAGMTDPAAAEAWFIAEGPGLSSGGEYNHYDNIMNPGYKYIGVGIARAANGLMYFLQDFGVSNEDDLGTSINPPSDTTPPSVPTGLSVTSATQNLINITWTASTDDSGQAPGYDIFLNGGLYATLAGGSPSAATISSLTCGTGYNIAIDAFDGSGNRSARTSIVQSTQNCGVQDSTPPTVPTGFGVTAKDQSSVSLNWNASTDNSGQPPGYDVYVNGSLYAILGNGINNTPTLDTVFGLSCGTNYLFTLDAFDASGNHSSLAALSQATQTCNLNSPPTIPTGLKVTAFDKSSVSLSWNISTDDSGQPPSYDIYINGSLITSLGSSTTSYTVSGLNCGTDYTFSVDAYDTNGDRSSPAAITSTTQNCTISIRPGDSNGDGSVNLSDLAILIANFNTSFASCDFNNDGVVNVYDLSILLSHYGT